LTIQCRTGCGAFVLYEMRPFPDGFIYHMPRNLDKTIHNCPNLPENVVNDERYENNIYWKEYRRLAIEIDIRSYTDWEQESNKTKIIENYKKELLLQQINCTLFPSPLMHGYVTSDDVDLPDKEKEVWWTNLTMLSDCYENLGMLDCAITALEIQNESTNNQDKKILELFKRRKNIDQQEVIKITALELRDKYLRKVERTIKDIFRKKLFESNLKINYKDVFDEAQKNMNKDKGKIKRKYHDVFEFLTFGRCVHVLNDEKSKARTEKKFDSFWYKFDRELIEQLYALVRIRNSIDHYSDDNLEDDLDEHEKEKGVRYCESVLNYFENLKYV
jgi:hypothetical protein